MLTSASPFSRDSAAMRSSESSRYQISHAAKPIVLASRRRFGRSPSGLWKHGRQKDCFRAIEDSRVGCASAHIFRGVEAHPTKRKRGSPLEDHAHRLFALLVEHRVRFSRLIRLEAMRD